MKTSTWRIRSFSFLLSLIMVIGIAAVGGHDNVSAVPLPQPPTSITIVPIQGTGAQVSWAPVIGASAYAVYRSTRNDGGFVKIGETFDTTFKNTGLTVGTLYYFKLKTIVTSYGSSYYTTPSGAKSYIQPPDFPTCVKAASVSYASIKLQWSAVAGADGYYVYRAPSLIGPYAKVKATVATTFTNTGLKTGTRYYYKIRSYAAVIPQSFPVSDPAAALVPDVFSPDSAVVSAVPVPGAPVGIAAHSAGASRIEITWTAVAGASGYAIYRSLQPGSGFVKINSTVDPGYLDTGLTTGTMYYYKVKAFAATVYGNMYSASSKCAGAMPLPVA